MSKPRRKPNPIEQYDRFMIGGKTPASVRGVVNITGAFVGNTLLWLTGLITIARIGMVFAFVVIAAITVGILQRLAPALDFAVLLLIGSITGLIMVSIGVLIVNGMLRRDAKRIGQQPTFGVYEEDMRDFRTNRRKPRR